MNFQLLDYAIKLLQRNLFKNLFTFLVLTMMTWLLASMFFITNSMKYELNLTLDTLPEIILQNKKAGMSSTIDETLTLKILEIQGVKSANGRVWGYYYFQNAGVYFSLFGIDEFEEQTRLLCKEILKENKLDTTSMIVGNGVAKILEKNHYKEYFNFIKEDGEIVKLNIAGNFKASTQLESNDMIVMDKNTLREIFGFTQSEATDIAIEVTNTLEVPTVALKLTQEFPNFRVLTKEDIRVSYENIFNYKNGLFLGLFLLCFFTFFIIVYDKLSGMTSEQKREIGILKAIGWRVEDVLKAKLYESLIISLFSYVLGIFLAFAFVYLFDAPLIRDIFIGYSDMKPAFELIFVLDFQTLFLLFFLSVPVYIAASIIPSWRVATLDAEEVMR